jgi:hypothetical protein
MTAPATGSGQFSAGQFSADLPALTSTAGTIGTLAGQSSST